MMDAIRTVERISRNMQSWRKGAYALGDGGK